MTEDDLALIVLLGNQRQDNQRQDTGLNEVLVLCAARCGQHTVDIVQRLDVHVELFIGGKSTTSPRGSAH